MINTHSRPRRTSQWIPHLRVLAVLAITLAIVNCAEEAPESPDEKKPDDIRPFVASDPSEYPKEIRGDITYLVFALFLYNHQVGMLPSTEEGLEALIHRPESPEAVNRWKGAYIVPDHKDDAFTDPWGHRYQYRRIDGGEQLFDLRSLGEDGVESEDDTTFQDFPDIAHLIR
jgi:type II secretion system protein G